MKKIIYILISMLLLTGCAFFKSMPEDSVKSFFSKYKNNDDAVVNELNNYLSTQDIDEDTLEKYREIYLRQYSNLDYKIKSTSINGDKATVVVEITVFDYYKTNIDSLDYITANQADFVNDDGDVDFSKYFAYKIDKLLNVEDTVTYTLNLSLTKIDDEWVVDTLTDDELEKIHGTYEY